jgi:hypothetical protein
VLRFRLAHRHGALTLADHEHHACGSLAACPFPMDSAIL